MTVSFNINLVHQLSLIIVVCACVHMCNEYDIAYTTCFPEIIAL